MLAERPGQSVWNVITYEIDGRNCQILDESSSAGRSLNPCHLALARLRQPHSFPAGQKINAEHPPTLLSQACMIGDPADRARTQ